MERRPVVPGEELTQASAVVVVVMGENRQVGRIEGQAETGSVQRKRPRGAGVEKEPVRASLDVE